MVITRNSVVTFDYTLTDSDGNVLDTSKGHNPFSYIQGHGHIIPGLEKAMEGKKKGDNFQVVVQPEEGYGHYDESLVASIPRSQFDSELEIEPGMQFHAERNGNYYTLTVTGVEEDIVFVDANHPLAGFELHFEVNIRDVRDATSEEIANGHVHGENGHHH